MTDGQDAELKNREFILKVVQAWADARNKVATGAILLNGAVIVTAATAMKDKGEAVQYLFGLKAATLGLLMGILALGFVWIITEQVYERMIKNEEDVQTRLISHWFPSLFFLACIVVSVGAFVGSIAFFTGYSQASHDLKESPCLFSKGKDCK
jgi:hypothetical protein